MRYVKYIGLAHRRGITADDWRSVGMTADTVWWDYTNQFMVPADRFTDEQIDQVINPDTGFIIIGTDDEPRRLEHDMTPAQAGSPRISLRTAETGNGGTGDAPDAENASAATSGAPTGVPGGDAPTTRARTGRGSGKD